MRKRAIWTVVCGAALVAAGVAVAWCALLARDLTGAQGVVRRSAELRGGLHRLELELRVAAAEARPPTDEPPAPALLAEARRRLEGLRAAERTPPDVRDLLLRCDARLSQAGRHDGPERSAELAEAAALIGDAGRLAGASLESSLAVASTAVVRVGTAGILAALLGLSAGGLVAARHRALAGSTRSARRSRLLAAAVRSVEEGVLVSDAGGRREPSIVFVNRSLCAMTGRSSAELVGHPLRALRDRSLDLSGFDGLEPSYSDTRSATIETVGQRSDGSRRNLEWHISPVRTEGGRITHYVSIIRDITDVREREAALARAAADLEEANRRLRANQQQLIQSEKMASLGRLSAGVAHEINNPVGYVMSNLEMVAEDLEALERPVESLVELEAAIASGEAGAVDLAARRLAGDVAESGLSEMVRELRVMVGESAEGLAQVRDIVHRLKSFARPDEGPPEPVEVNQLVESALRIAGPELKHKCEVETRLGDLPTLWGRPGQLAQVLTNLLVNAAQSIPDEGRVTVETMADGDTVIIDVSDTGIGIPPENLGDLFTPFFTTKPVGQGTGLGLSVSYGIVTAHGGSIEVDSEPGRGSRFRVTLPVGRAG